MAEAFLLPLATELLVKIASDSVREIGRICSVESDLDRLAKTLPSIKAVLSDAAKQQVNNEGVRVWLENLQDVLYQLDDLFDDFMTEDLRRKLEIGESKRKQVRNFFSSSNPLAFRVKMSRKIKELRERLEEVNTDRKNYQFVEGVLSNDVAHRSREETHSFVHVSDVIGRDREKKEILKLLVDSRSQDNNNLSVLPIVGLGGLGKTTLAKLVYNDPWIDQNFDKQIWLCVSEEFDIKKLVKKIIKATDISFDVGDLDLNQLQICLRNHLESIKFFLVLDDVWNEDPKKWNDLKDLLKCGKEGSIILVTTRNKKIAEFMGTLPLYSLEGLSSDHCLSIFLKCAFKDGQGRAYPNLVEIGKAIVNKCGGVPLAVRSLGSLLCTSTEESKWNEIKDSDIWKIKQEENDILPILRLSYEQMPIHLKQCFSYCSTLPKDFVFFPWNLIYRWISQGLIQSSDGNRQLEDIGAQYINDLVSRSFFQDVVESFDNKINSFKMHDLVHDLAQSVAGNEISVVNLNTENVMPKNVRHLLFDEAEKIEGEDFPRSLLKLEKVRTFQFAFVEGPISKNFVDALIKSFNCLRVLDLGGSEFEELPDSIGTLRHLRFLNLIGNRRIKTLPNSFCNLLNLLFLGLGNCLKLEKLPKDFDKLRSLRFLALSSEIITCLPEKGLQGFTSLRTLLIVNCDCLESLSEGVQHLTALRQLIIDNCPRLTCIPQSIRCLTSLEKLVIVDCEKLDLLGIEGLTSLQFLLIKGLPMLKELPLGLEESSATLKYLIIDDCTCLESLTLLNNFTSLLRLNLENLKCLESLPSGMHQLQYLEIEGCPLLSEKCKRETGEYWPWIQHISDVLIEGVWIC